MVVSLILREILIKRRLLITFSIFSNPKPHTAINAMGKKQKSIVETVISDSRKNKINSMKRNTKNPKNTRIAIFSNLYSRPNRAAKARRCMVLCISQTLNSSYLIIRVPRYPPACPIGLLYESVIPFCHRACGKVDCEPIAMVAGVVSTGLIPAERTSDRNGRFGNTVRCFLRSACRQGWSSSPSIRFRMSRGDLICRPA